MYIARQAIFDRELKVYGYELLYRKSINSTQYDGVSSVQSSAAVLNGLYEIGLNKISDNKISFINFDSDFIHSDSLELIGPNDLVIEVLENVTMNDKLIQRIKYLKQRGYQIALDDFVSFYNTYPLVPLTDIIKFDILATPLDTIYKDVKKAIAQKKILLAEKIENIENFNQAKEMGFQLFQGYFFSKPYIVEKSSDVSSTKYQYTRLIAELNQLEPSYQKLAEIIELDVNLAYRLVKVSSMHVGEDLIYSIKNALTYMGLKSIHRWIHVLMIKELSSSKPDELMRISLVRSKFCESIAMHGNFFRKKYEASIMGLFSVIDAILDQTMKEALENVAITDAIKEALIYKTGDLMPVYDLMLAYEHAEWEHADILINQMNISEPEVNKAYLEALNWSTQIMDLMTSQ